MVLAGLIAGGLTASTAFRSTPVVEVAASTPALATAPSEASAAPVPAPAPPIGTLRVDEAAHAEWTYRVNLANQPSRATNTPGSLVRPAPGALTGWFGEARGSRRHGGIDFDGDTGDAVIAAGVGTVVHAGPAPAGYSGYGLMVLIDHGNGVETLYAHLSAIAVGHGAQVQPGDLIGAIGTTGNVTGSHLHFEVRHGGRTVDPAVWIAGSS